MNTIIEDPVLVYGIVCGCQLTSKSFRGLCEHFGRIRELVLDHLLSMQCMGTSNVSSNTQCPETLITSFMGWLGFVVSFHHCKLIVTRTSQSLLSRLTTEPGETTVQTCKIAKRLITISKWDKGTSGKFCV